MFEIVVTVIGSVGIGIIISIAYIYAIGRYEGTFDKIADWFIRFYDKGVARANQKRGGNDNHGC